MICCPLKRLAARRLARQYAIEMVRECEESGCAPETVTGEAVIARMEADGLEADRMDWGGLLAFLLALIEQLRTLFAPEPVSTQSEPKPGKATKAS